MSKIFVNRIIIKNRAPFENLDLSFSENEIAVLTAINGSGKTTLLSYIVDACHEIVRSHYPQTFKGKENNYYRISSSLFCLDKTKPSYVYIRFKNQSQNIDYVDVSNNCTQDQYNETINFADKIPFERIKSELEIHGNIKLALQVDLTTQPTNSKDLNFKDLQNIFNHNVITYFPAYRYETPAYLNDPYKIHLDFSKDWNFTGKLNNPLEVVTGLPQLANWIMDVVLDMELYKQSQEVQLPDGNKQTFEITRERINLWGNLNTIIRQTLISKQNRGIIRFAIGKRNSAVSRISIVNDRSEGGIIETVYPSIFGLSSGEASILCLFGEILRQADTNINNIALPEISGIVLIDEIDKHLHIRLQKEVLPKLFGLFPNVQFLVSSHSPFLNMGLTENSLTKTRATIIDLDLNAIRIPLQENSIYQEVYQMMVTENENYAKQLKELSEKTTKPVLFVEDKIIQIYKVAFLKLKEITFEENNIDQIFENNAAFYIYGKGNRNNLRGFLDNPSMKEWDDRIIAGLFDFDDAYEDYLLLKKEWETISENDRTGLYKKRHDCNVYALMLPIPEFRKRIAGKGQKVKQLEVELLFTDEKIAECYGNSDYATEKIIDDLHIPKIKNKNDFWKKVCKLNKDDFNAFQQLFDNISVIFKI